MSQSLPQLLRRALPRYNNNHNNNGLDKLSPRLRIQRCRTVHIPRPFSTSPPRPYLAQLLSALPAPLVPPVVFIGLALSLWAYKCLMMVVFQNKIIYMPSMPPFSRSERIEDYRGMCGGVGWEEGRIRSGDGVEIAVCTGRIPAEVEADAKKKKKHVVVLYFQGYVVEIIMKYIFNKLINQSEATAPPHPPASPSSPRSSPDCTHAATATQPTPSSPSRTAATGRPAAAHPKRASSATRSPRYSTSRPHIRKKQRATCSGASPSARAWPRDWSRTTRRKAFPRRRKSTE